MNQLDDAFSVGCSVACPVMHETAWCMLGSGERQHVAYLLSYPFHRLSFL